MNDSMVAVLDGMMGDNLTRDAIIIRLVSEHGLTLNKATATYQEYAKDKGISKALVSKKDEAFEYMASLNDVEWDDSKWISDLMHDLRGEFGVAESTARDYIKAYAKEKGIIIPSADPRADLFVWLKVNDGTYDDVAKMKEAFIEFGTALGRSRSNLNEYWKGYELHLFIMGE